MVRGFSEEDKFQIKEKLKRACEQSWKTNGYKRTSIPYLTKTVGISTGAFYLMYETKEQLFIEVLEKVQENLLRTWAGFIQEEESSFVGFKKGMKWLFKEYRQYPALYNFNNSEYDLFFAKLPQEQVTQLKEKSLDIFSEVIHTSNLHLLLPEKDAIDIIHTILFLATIDRDTLTATETSFEFLLDHSLPGIFKEENR